MAAPKKLNPSSFTPQSRKAALAEDKNTPGKHNPYSTAEAQKEAMWQYIMKRKKSSKPSGS